MFTIWCQISIRILWSDVWKFYKHRKSDKSLQILSTLIACLPGKSKNLLHSKNRIFISTSPSKLPLFKYASFCKVLSISKIDYIIKSFLSLDADLVL